MGINKDEINKYVEALQIVSKRMQKNHLIMMKNHAKMFDWVLAWHMGQQRIGKRDLSKHLITNWQRQVLSVLKFYSYYQKFDELQKVIQKSHSMTLFTNIHGV